MGQRLIKDKVAKKHSLFSCISPNWLNKGLIPSLQNGVGGVLLTKIAVKVANILRGYKCALELYDINSLQWNLDLTNLYLSKRFSLLQFSKIYGKEPRDNETLSVANRFASPLALCYILVFMVFLVCIHGFSLRLWNICTFFIILFFPLEMLCVSPNLIVMVKQPFNMSMKHCKKCLSFWTPIFFVRQPFNMFRLPKIELWALMGSWCDSLYSVKKIYHHFDAQIIFVID